MFHVLLKRISISRAIDGQSREAPTAPPSGVLTSLRRPSGPAAVIPGTITRLPMGCRASVAAVVDDLTTLGARDHWTVTGGVATYAPKPGGWTAQVRAVRVAAHSYERWHIAIIDPHGTARHTCFASLIGEAARVAESRVRAATIRR